MSSVLLVAGGCLGIWLLSLSSLSNEELLVGSLCSLSAGAVAVAAKRATNVRWSVRAIPLRPLLRVPVAVVSDTAQVLLRILPGVGRPAKVVTLETRQRGDSAPATTSRVATALAVTSAPGSLVLDLDAKTGRLMLHSLQCTGAHPEDGLEAQ